MLLMFLAYTINIPAALQLDGAPGAGSAYSTCAEVTVGCCEGYCGRGRLGKAERS